MSLQKSKSARKFQSNTETHTRSNLVNTLINQKLFQEKESVKNRFAKLVKNTDNGILTDRPSSSSGFKVRKFIGSLKNINVSIQKIKQAITFDPLKQLKSQQAQFIISRQYNSPLVDINQIDQLVQARNNSHLVQVKLSQKDKQGYSYTSLSQTQLRLEIESNKDFDSPKLNLEERKWVQKIESQLDNQLWLPASPYTQILLQNLQENSQKLNLEIKNFNDLPVVKGPTFSNHGNSFAPLVSSPSPKISKNVSELNLQIPSSKLLQNIHTQKQQIVYDFKKYNNNDFLALQKWFQKNITLAHQKQKKNENIRSTITIKDSQIVNKNQKQLLNLLYSIHIAAFQQLIRLHYIEAWQKAIVFQKMFWSLIRLFAALMEQQHRINFTEFKLFQKQLKDQRLMYESRCQKLQRMMLRAQQEASSTQILRKKLSLAYVTYSRVNHYLSQQLEVINKNYSQLQGSFNYLNLRMMKVIEHMKIQNKIKTIINQNQTVYYLIVDNSDHLQELIRFKTSPEQAKNIINKKIQQEVQEKLKKEGKLSFHKSSQKDRQSIIGQILAKRALLANKFQEKPVFQTRIGERISKVQHELNKYWANKEQFLQVNKIVRSQLLNYETADISTSTYQKYEFFEFGCQFPQKQQKSFAQFLKQELQKSKQSHQKQIKQQTDLYVSLKELYEESYKRIKFLQNKNKQLQKQISSKQKIIGQKDIEVKALQAEIIKRQSELQSKLEGISQLLKQKNTLQQRIHQMSVSIQEGERKFQSEMQNSKALVKNNLLLKQKLEKINIKLNETEKKLSDSLAHKQQIQIQLSKSKEDYEQILKKYQELDKKLQKIAPTVDKFLDFKRYDSESIIISNLKRQLQKFFPDYFCKDSDVFLTKG